MLGPSRHQIARSDGKLGIIVRRRDADVGDTDRQLLGRSTAIDRRVMHPAERELNPLIQEETSAAAQPDPWIGLRPAEPLSS
jgi:hypothetical protein